MNGHGVEEKWNQTLEPIGQSRRRNWERIIPFFGYPLKIRKVIYATNAIESINMSCVRSLRLVPE